METSRKIDCVNIQARTVVLYATPYKLAAKTVIETIPREGETFLNDVINPGYHKLRGTISAIFLQIL